MSNNDPRESLPLYISFFSGVLMTSAERVPILDGHNDVLLRLYRRGGTDVVRSFLEGRGEGQLDLPMARQGGFAGGLFAIFVPSRNEVEGVDGETRKRGSHHHAPPGIG
jgi:Membrane dipeptidase (Peptidase family M19)